MQTFAELIKQVREIDAAVQKTRPAPLTTPEAFAAISHSIAGLNYVAGAAAAASSVLSQEEIEVHLSAVVTAGLLCLSGLFPDFGLSDGAAHASAKTPDKLLALVVEMRAAQRQFSSTKDRAALIKAKTLEASIDKLLSEVVPHAS